MKRILTLSICLAAVWVALGQSLSVQAPKSVYVGDQFTVRFTVDDRGQLTREPELTGVRKLQGPNTSSQSSMSWVNGKTTSSTSTSFSFVMLAEEEGEATIGAATCRANGKEVSSQPVRLTIIKPTAAQQAQRQQQQAQRQQQRQRQAYDPWGNSPQPAQQEITEKNLFARASVSNSHPYQGQQVIVTYKVYTQVPISQYGIDKLPGNRGFWTEDLTDPNMSQVKRTEEVIDGEVYQVAEIRRGALFAQESGQLTIEPMDMTVLAMVQRQRRRTGSVLDLFDDAFFSIREAVERTLSTRRLTINVKPLPPAPEGFTGGVGTFDVKGGLSLTEVKANEAVSYRLTINGSGNLMLINAPEMEFPASFEVYDPQVEDNLRRSDNGISGTRTYEWVLIPRAQGSYTIPELHFVYFDPAAGRYVTKTIAAQQLEVAKGDPHSTTTTAKDDVRLLNSDINYIHPISRLGSANDGEGLGWLFWVALGAVIVATGTACLLLRRKATRQQDEVGTRQRRALRIARKRLHQAEAHLKAGDQGAFYEAIYRAIWGCLSDKYNIELARLSRESVAECLQSKQVPQQQQDHIMRVLEDVDFARFAPGDAHKQMQRIYDEALQMIVSLS